MAEKQPPAAPTSTAETSEADGISRFAEHVNERKRRKNLWGKYVDEKSRTKRNTSVPVATPVVSVSSEADVTKETRGNDMPEMKKTDANGSVQFEDDVKTDTGMRVKRDVDKDGFVKTPCVGGLPRDHNSRDLYEL